MAVEREVESLIFDDGEPARHAHIHSAPEDAEPEAAVEVAVEIERDPLVLTPDDAAALPPDIEELAHAIDVQSPPTPAAASSTLSPAPEALLPGPADSHMLLMTLGVAVVLALLAVLLARRSSRKKGSDVLLVGPSDAGKTALFASLVHGRAPPTHTSMQPNLAFLPRTKTKTKTRVVDVPGHARLRAQGLADHLPDAKGVLFVVDAATVARNGAAVAEHLHEVLAALLAQPTSSPPPLTIVASKLDLAPQGAARVRSVLERELDKRRAARVDVEGEKDEGEVGTGLDTRGRGTGTFRLAEWEGGEVGVVGCSVRGSAGAGLGGGEKETGKEEQGWSEVREWIEGLES